MRLDTKHVRGAEHRLPVWVRQRVLAMPPGDQLQRCDVLRGASVGVWKQQPVRFPVQLYSRQQPMSVQLRGMSHTGSSQQAELCAAEVLTCCQLFGCKRKAQLDIFNKVQNGHF
jgi:hypothetical protein